MKHANEMQRFKIADADREKMRAQSEIVIRYETSRDNVLMKFKNHVVGDTLPADLFLTMAINWRILLTIPIGELMLMAIRGTVLEKNRQAISEWTAIVTAMNVRSELLRDACISSLSFRIMSRKRIRSWTMRGGYSQNIFQ